MISAIRHIHERRNALLKDIDVLRQFEDWEETCVPSYCHRNLAAAYVSWWRLFKSVKLARKYLRGSSDPVVLDFGSSVGEVGQLIKPWAYHFVEIEEHAAQQLQAALPDAVRKETGELENGFYDVIFALDSLEHNKDFPELLQKLCEALKPGGICVVSGPTENWLYRFGRKLAGFDGHYHETNIFHIENAADAIFSKVRVASLPVLLPLFRISVWRKAT